jgi:hypothetical protein
MLFDDPSLEDSLMQNTLGLLHLLSTVKPLGLSSFLGSSVCRFYSNVWKQQMDKIVVGLEYLLRV